MKGACRVVAAKPALLLMLARRPLGEVTLPAAFPVEEPSNLGLPKPVIRDVPVAAVLDVDEIEVGLLPPPNPWIRLCTTQRPFECNRRAV